MPSQTDSFGRYTDTYTTFSGADIVCAFAGVEIGALSGIAWSITREKAPVYTMGSPNPRSFSRGKRGIAGTLMFTVFDRPGLYNLLRKGSEENVKYFTRAHNILPGANGLGDKHFGLANVQEQSINVRAVTPFYADQIPPFDISITFANEYGQAAVRSLYGVEIINEGSGASMDDIVIEENMTFVARDCGPMISTGIDFSTSNLNVSGFEGDAIYTPQVNFGG